MSGGASPRPKFATNSLDQRTRLARRHRLTGAAWLTWIITTEQRDEIRRQKTESARANLQSALSAYGIGSKSLTATEYGVALDLTVNGETAGVGVVSGDYAYVD